MASRFEWVREPALVECLEATSVFLFLFLAMQKRKAFIRGPLGEISRLHLVVLKMAKGMMDNIITSILPTLLYGGAWVHLYIDTHILKYGVRGGV